MMREVRTQDKRSGVASLWILTQFFGNRRGQGKSPRPPLQGGENPNYRSFRSRTINLRLNNAYRHITPWILCLGFFLILTGDVFGIQRFPPPQFTSGHELPVTAQPPPRAGIYEYLDVVVLVLALSVASYLALRRRSRRGILILGIFSLLYFGFWRKGCVCPIGAIQNVTLAFFDHSYTVPIAIVAFFALPLLFTLFFGRTFCASVCPLGAIQDIVLLRPIKVPLWLENALRILAYTYLSLAVLFAATGSAFIICEYDPFVAFFRRSGSLNMLILGISFLVIGIFIGRPYCRYLCPYGILLGWVSRASKWHVTITPGECIKCRLCEDSCPYAAIQKPTRYERIRYRDSDKKKLAFLIGSVPALVMVGILIGAAMGTPLSRVNSKVIVAEQIWLEDTGEVKEPTDASKAYRETGRTSEESYQEALDLDRKFTIGGGIFGGFLGLVLGMKIIRLSVRRSREDYQANRTTCLSCGRCFSYCPVGKQSLGRRRR